MRQMQGGGRAASSFGKSRRGCSTSRPTASLSPTSPAAMKPRSEVSELVDFLRDPTKFQKLGGRIPKGCCWSATLERVKTLLARPSPARPRSVLRSPASISSKCSSASAPPASARHVRERQETRTVHHLHRRTRCGRSPAWRRPRRWQRRARADPEPDAGRDGRLQNRQTGVIVIAATNRPDVLDPALMRPGRFDRQVVVPCPISGGREQILVVHMRKVPLSRTSRPTSLPVAPRFSGADLANLVKRGCAVRRARQQAPGRHGGLREGQDKIAMGAERRSMVMNGGGAPQHRVSRIGPRRRRQADALIRYKVTIIPREFVPSAHHATAGRGSLCVYRVLAC